MKVVLPWMRAVLKGLLFFSLGCLVFALPVVLASLFLKVVPGSTRGQLIGDLVSAGLILSGGFLSSATTAFGASFLGSNEAAITSERKVRGGMAILLALSFLAGFLVVLLVLGIGQVSKGMADFSLSLFVIGWQVLWIRESRRRQEALQKQPPARTDPL